jgi:hypothetical protein
LLLVFFFFFDFHQSRAGLFGQPGLHWTVAATALSGFISLVCLENEKKRENVKTCRVRALIRKCTTTTWLKKWELSQLSFALIFPSISLTK